MSYTVAFSPKARVQLIELDAYIDAVTSPEIATRYPDAVADFCFFVGDLPTARVYVAMTLASGCASQTTASAP